jgi:hypothetical protein
MVKFKLMYDKDEEVLSLNEEANKGNAFRKFFLGFYFFEKSEEGKYIYDIDLLSSCKDFANFRKFMNDSNVEVLNRWYRWVYVRKVNDSKGFELYSDVDSKIEHYHKIMKLFKAAFIIEVVCLFVEIFIPLINKRMEIMNFIFISIIAFFAICLYGAYTKMSAKAGFYKQQKDNIGLAD